MVVLNEPVVRAELERRGWSETKLAADMDVHYNSVRNMLSGKPVSHSTQVALFNAFDGLIPFEKLLVLTPGDDVAADLAPAEAAR